MNGGGGPIVVKLGDSQAFSQQLTERADALALATGRAVVAGRVLSVPAPWIGRDAPHAFYLGAELMKAEIGWRLGKRYAQDEPLDWGYAVDRAPEDRTRLRRDGHTLAAWRPDDTSSNRHPALAYCWSMIFSENRYPPRI